jgi:3',5'-cyclic-AMP phosphodiesterase
MRSASFVHITDTHIGNDHGADDTLFSNTRAHLDYVLDQVRSLPRTPDFVIVSGDLTNRGEPESFDHVRERFAALGLPVVFALGNHDARRPFYERVLQEPARGDAPYDHDVVHAGVHVVVLDSSVPGSHIGGVDDDQLTWLRDALQRHPELPKLVVVHHPPAPVPHPVFDFLNLRAGDAERIGDALAGADVLAVLSGHVHHDQYMVWRGVPCIVSAGLHNITDVVTEHALRAVDGGAFGIGDIVDGALRYVSVPLPGQLRELHSYDVDRIRSYLTSDHHAPDASPA